MVLCQREAITIIPWRYNSQQFAGQKSRNEFSHFLHVIELPIERNVPYTGKGGHPQVHLPSLMANAVTTRLLVNVGSFSQTILDTWLGVFNSESSFPSINQLLDFLAQNTMEPARSCPSTARPSGTSFHPQSTKWKWWQFPQTDRPLRSRACADCLRWSHCCLCCDIADIPTFHPQWRFAAKYASYADYPTTVRWHVLPSQFQCKVVGCHFMGSGREAQMMKVAHFAGLSSSNFCWQYSDTCLRVAFKRDEQDLRIEGDQRFNIGLFRANINRSKTLEPFACHEWVRCSFLPTVSWLQ